ncbi:MAG TPA: hypothetical protein VEJ45_11620 [Candidatus Acidoferrales bacterium]|nr:hypothetical protein [Candidatus Acidoferrales bacterium]
MRHLIGLAVLALGLVLPTHAQAMRSASGVANPTSAGSGSGGGGGLGGGFGGGSTIGGRLTYYPLAHFSVTSVSGTQQDYVPSTFVSYDQAVATGQNELDTPPLTVAAAARQQASTHPGKAKIAVMQDDRGKVIIVSR